MVNVSLMDSSRLLSSTEVSVEPLEGKARAISSSKDALVESELIKTSPGIESAIVMSLAIRTARSISC